MGMVPVVGSAKCLAGHAPGPKKLTCASDDIGSTAAGGGAGAGQLHPIPRSANQTKACDLNQPVVTDEL